MSRQPPSFAQLFSHPSLQDDANPKILSAISRSVERAETKEKTPIYINIISTVGAWFVALTAMIITYDTFFHFNDGTSHLALGIFLISISIVGWNYFKIPFVKQLALVFAFLGSISILIAADDFNILSRDIHSVAIAQLAITPFIYWLHKSAVVRFCLPLLCSILFDVWTANERDSILFFTLLGIKIILICVLHIRKNNREILKPLKYSVIFMAVVSTLFMSIYNLGASHYSHSNRYITEWPTSIIFALALLYMSYHWSGDIKKLPARIWVVITLSIVILGAIGLPGVLLAFLLLTLGYFHDDPVLTTISYLLLPYFLVVYYYSLDVSLAMKSAIIFGSGAVLLIARLILKRNQLAQGEKTS